MFVSIFLFLSGLEKSKLHNYIQRDFLSTELGNKTIKELWAATGRVWHVCKMTSEHLRRIGNKLKLWFFYNLSEAKKLILLNKEEYRPFCGQRGQKYIRSLLSCSNQVHNQGGNNESAYFVIYVVAFKPALSRILVNFDSTFSHLFVYIVRSFTFLHTHFVNIRYRGIWAGVSFTLQRLKCTTFLVQ